MPAAVPSGADRGDDKAYGRRRKPDILNRTNTLYKDPVCGVCPDRVLNVKIRKNQQMPYGHRNKENGTL